MKTNITNKKFGRLEAISFGFNKTTPNGTKMPFWLCTCICGKKVYINKYALISQKTKSCGCLRQETSKKVHTFHNSCHTTEYRTWQSMKSRCTNPKKTDFYLYGGRGIKVCKEWSQRNGFKKFQTDMGKKPSKEHTLERIDTNGNYTPQNCKWSTPKEQANNRRSNIMISFNGKTQNLKQWCEELGFEYGLIALRSIRLRRRKLPHTFDKIFF